MRSVFLFTITKVVDRVFNVGVELFDATYLSSTESLEEVVDVIAVYVQNNPGIGTNEVAAFIEETFSIDSSGQLNSINGTFIELDVSLSANRHGGIAETLTVTVTQDSEGGQKQKLANQEETILVFLEVFFFESNTPSPSTCTVGSVFTTDVITVAEVYVSDEYN